jgi:hypothetical protein
MTDPVNNKQNNRNGLLLKIVIGVLATGFVSTAGGMIKLNSEVQILKSETVSVTDRRLNAIEGLAKDGLALARDIDVDRHKRSETIPRLRVDVDRLEREIEEMKKQLDRIERRLK